MGIVSALKRQIAGQCCRLRRLSRDKVLGATSLATSMIIASATAGSDRDKDDAD
jgi:hypothetical protein